MADLDYASPRPPRPMRESECAVIAAWCAGIGSPGLVALYLCDVFHIPIPRWMDSLFIPLVIPSLALLTVGLFLSINSLAQREPRWRLATVAGIVCGALLAWSLLLATDW